MWWKRPRQLFFIRSYGTLKATVPQYCLLRHTWYCKVAIGPSSNIFLGSPLYKSTYLCVQFNHSKFKSLITLHNNNVGPTDKEFILQILCSACSHWQHSSIPDSWLWHILLRVLLRLIILSCPMLLLRRVLISVKFQKGRSARVPVASVMGLLGYGNNVVQNSLSEADAKPCTAMSILASSLTAGFFRYFRSKEGRPTECSQSVWKTQGSTSGWV